MLALFVIGCNGGGGREVNIVENPFIGGSQGLTIAFQDFRSEVFDGGLDPFDVIVKVENEGESLISKDNVQVTLSGINPSEFGKSQADLTKLAPDDVIEERKDPSGNIVPGPPVFVEFPEFNYRSALTGATAQFTLRADVCYLYRTKAVSKLCVRENLLTPTAGGICELNEQKTIHNSGAPVHVQNLKQTTRSKDKIGFTFEIANVGNGDIFERNSHCDRDDRRKEDRVYVKVHTGMSGLACTGLNPTQTGAEGWTTLYNNRKIISCSQSVTNKADFEQLTNIEVIYDYEQRTQTTITVKSSGE